MERAESRARKQRSREGGESRRNAGEERTGTPTQRGEGRESMRTARRRPDGVVGTKEVANPSAYVSSLWLRSNMRMRTARPHPVMSCGTICENLPSSVCCWNQRDDHPCLVYQRVISLVAFLLDNLPSSRRLLDNQPSPPLLSAHVQP